MNVTVLIGPNSFEQALAAAATVGVVPIGGGANAPVSALVLGFADEAWLRIEAAISDAYTFGKEKAEQAYDAVVAKVDEVTAKAGARAKEVHRLLLERLAVYSQGLIRLAVAQVTAVMKVGEVELRLASLNCTQKIVMNGSLKTSLKEMIQLAATGELSVEASYTRG